MDIENILKNLTLEEKAALVQGWSMWATRDLSKKGVPSISLANGHSIRGLYRFARDFLRNKDFAKKFEEKLK